MKILFDHQIFSFQEYGGISRYFYRLIEGINKTKNNNAFVDGKFSNNVYLTKMKSHMLGFLPDFNFPYKHILIFYTNIIFGGSKVKKERYDVLHPTYYHPYFMNRLNGRPYVITVHDMIHEIFSSQYKDLRNKTSEYKKKVILGANAIITISESTKKDLMKFYKISEEKVTVIHLGNNFENTKPKTYKDLPKKYLLFVGTRRGYKNFNNFIRYVSTVLKKHKDLYLVCAGGGQFEDTEKKQLSDLGVDTKVFYRSFKTDEELAGYYKQARVYIIPSLYEGFGLTVLEAFSMSCPVIASNISSLPEVCGDAVYYIDPKSAKSISNAVEELYKNKTIRLQLINKGYKQLKKFSWDKTVKETLRVYERVIAE